MRMEHGGRWRSGNNHVDRRVVPLMSRCRSSGERCDPGGSDDHHHCPLAPVSMSHLERFTDGDWVEPSDEPQGTAVFDATGDQADHAVLG